MKIKKGGLNMQEEIRNCGCNDGCGCNNNSGCNNNCGCGNNGGFLSNFLADVDVMETLKYYSS